MPESTGARVVDEGEVFEIFQQTHRDAPLQHGGNLRAPDEELAIHYAREFYGRRQESYILWIIRRSAIRELRIQQGQIAVWQALDGKAASSDQSSGTVVVFAQLQPGKPFIWQQDLKEMTLDAVAQELAQRKQEQQTADEADRRYWLMLRKDIVVLENQDLLQPPLDRSYRRLDGYNIREKLRAARQRVQEEQRRQS